MSLFYFIHSSFLCQAGVTGRGDREGGRWWGGGKVRRYPGVVGKAVACAYGGVLVRVVLVGMSMGGDG